MLNFLNDEENYRKINVGLCHPTAITDLDKRKILRIASNFMLTAEKTACNSKANLLQRNIKKID